MADVYERIRHLVINQFTGTWWYSKFRNYDLLEDLVSEVFLSLRTTRMNLVYMGRDRLAVEVSFAVKGDVAIVYA